MRRSQPISVGIPTCMARANRSKRKTLRKPPTQRLINGDGVIRLIILLSKAWSRGIGHGGSEAPRARTDNVSIGFEIQNEENYVGHCQRRSREKLKRPRQESNL